MGVMITGESGLGKSELGLELISRGHGLVADDAVDLYRINQTSIEGRCPELLQNLLEVRGIGLLDIKAIFGETAVRRKMRLKLIVHLVRKETMEREFERLNMYAWRGSHASLRGLEWDAIFDLLFEVVRYKRHHVTAAGLASPAIAAEFLVHANEEAGHGDRLAERIVHRQS